MAAEAEEGFGGDFPFRRYRLDVVRHYELGPDQFLDIRTRMGFADRELPLQRRFQLGGIGTLRGYKYKEFQGDRMFLGQVEYRLQRGRVALIPFVDASYAWPRNQDIGLRCNGGVGLALGGLRINLAVAPPRPAQWELRFRRTLAY